MKQTMPIDGKLALAPVISAETLSFHHGKHLAGYVNNLNAALPGSGLEGMSIEQIVLNTPSGMHNNAGQILNHNLYFSQFRSPRADNAPTGKLAHAKCRQSHPAWAAPADDDGRVGACLLPRLPEPSPRPPGCPVADYRLGRGGSPL